MSLTENHIFISPVYFSEKKDWVEKVNKISDPYIQKAREENKNKLINNKDFAMVHHSTPLTKDENFKDFLQYINSNAFDILNNQEDFRKASSELDKKLLNLIKKEL